MAEAPGREMIAAPEVGRRRLGCNLHGLRSSWADVKVLRGELEKCWQRAVEKMEAAEFQLRRSDTSIVANYKPNFWKLSNNG